jgi:hypothetical protein
MNNSGRQSKRFFSVAVSGGDIFLQRGNSQRIELGFRIERERVSKHLYRLLLNHQWICPFFQKPVFSGAISAMTQGFFAISIMPDDSQQV